MEEEGENFLTDELKTVRKKETENREVQQGQSESRREGQAADCLVLPRRAKKMEEFCRFHEKT